MDASNSDWKSTISFECRFKQVTRILDVLKTCYQTCASVNLAELTRMAEWFEQDIFDVATSYEDYWHQVLVKTVVMEKKMLPDASDDMQPQVHNQGQSQNSLPNQSQTQQHQNVQNTTVSDEAQSSNSSPPALPSMAYLTQSPLPNAAGLGLNIHSGNAQNFVGSSDSQGLPSVMQSHIPQQPQNLLQPTPMLNAAVQRQRINIQSGIAHNFVGSSDSQGFRPVMQSHIPQQQLQNLLQPTPMSNAAVQRQMINMQFGIAQNFVGSSANKGFRPVMQSHIPQQSQQQPQNLLQPTQMSNAAVQRQRINMQSGIAQNFVGSSVNQGLPSVMQSHTPQQSQQQLPNLLQPSQMSNAVGPWQHNPWQHNPWQHNPRQYNPRQYNPWQHNPWQHNPRQYNPWQHNPRQYNPRQYNPWQHNLQQHNPQQHNPWQYNPQQHNLQQHNLRQHNPQQHNPWQHIPQLFSSSLNSNAQTGQNVVDLHEVVYQMIQAMKNMYLPYLNVIHDKISKEYQQSPQPEGQELLKLLEIQIEYLNFSKNQISPTWMEYMPQLEMQIQDMINSNLPQEPVSAQQQIQQPGGHPLSTQPQQQQQEADDQQQQQQQQQQEQEEEVDNQPDATQD